MLFDDRRGISLQGIQYPTLLSVKSPGAIAVQNTKDRLDSSFICEALR